MDKLTVQRCSFCGGSEPHSQDLLVCGSCVSKFVGRDHTTLENLAAGNALSKEQLAFLGVSQHSKTRLAPIAKK